MTILEGQARPGSGKRVLALGCGGLALLLFTVAAGYLWWANTPPPPEPAPVAALPSPNGFDACVAAAGRLPAPSARSALDNPLRADPAAIRQALKLQQPTLDELRRALRLEYVTPPAARSAVSTGYLGAYREAARSFSAESRLAQSEGRWGEAIQRSLDAIDLGTKAGRGAPFIQYLVGMAVISIGHVQAERCVRQLSATEAHAAGRRMDRLIAQLSSAEDTMRHDRPQALADLRKLFTGETTPAQLTALPGTPPSPTDAIVARLYPKPWAYGELKRGYDDLLAELAKPYPQRQPIRPPRDELAEMELPDLEKSGVSFTNNETYLRLLRLELALQEYRARHHRYPSRLSELAPEAISAVPNDPFTEKPLRYRSTGPSYLLYSTGPDQRDDGGRPLPAGNLGTAPGDIVAGKLYQRRVGSR
jgi:hypothetical protein